MKPAFAAHTPAQDSGRWHELAEHLQDVAELSSALAAKLNFSDLGYYAGLWHDLGKYNPKFQVYLEQCHRDTHFGQRPRSVPHAIHGAVLVARAGLELLAPIIYGHHAGLPEIQNMKAKLTEAALSEDYQAVLQAAEQDLGSLSLPPDFQLPTDDRFQDRHSTELFVRLLFSCLVDADYLDTEAHFQPKLTQQRGYGPAVDALWEALQVAQADLLAKAPPTPVNQIRAEVYDACLQAAVQSPGVFRLAVPTGGGKTRSGLAFALRHAVQHTLRRVIIAVPYTSIIEQTVGVYRALLGDDSVLEHHSAIQPDRNNEEDARQRQAQARLASQNWDASLIVTTTVQFFESLFANRPSRCRKLHNIIGSVIILDEVQTLPTGLLAPILSVLKELTERYQVTVVLCTATQPALQGETPYLQGFATDQVRDIIPTTKATQHFVALSRVTYEVPQTPWQWADVAADLQAHQQTQALMILNTRKNALRVLEALTDSNTEVPCFHLSTLLCGAHRRAVLDQVRSHLHQDRPCYLVSTQVVEAGVDLDFPAVYRALGPLDRIVQAAGRCNREGKRSEKGRVVIFEPAEGNTPPGEYRTACDTTARLLRQTDLDWDDPGLFDAYFRQLYRVTQTDAENIQAFRAALNYPEVAQKFRLIKDDTTAVVVRYDDRVRSLLQRIRRRGLYASDHQALQPYLVNLRSQDFNASADVRTEIAPGVWVWDGNYDPVLGIGIGDRAIAYDPSDLIL